MTSSTSSTTTTSSQSSSSSSSSGSGNNGASFGGASSTTGVISLQASGTGVNTDLPTNSQLDAWINSADIVAIRQTIQKVIASTLTCTAKMQYLSDLLGRIETFIAIKKSQLQQHSQIFSSSSEQITSLRQQISTYTQNIINLNLPDLERQLQLALNQLQIAYNEFNAANVDLTPFNLNITANLQSIKNLTGQLETTTINLKRDQEALVDTNTLIASLEKQLADARENKNKLEARILIGINNSSNLKSRIDLLNANNVALNNEINNINSRKVTLQANYQALETRAEGIRNTINARRSQEQKYNVQIDTLNKQIGELTGNLDTAPVERLNQTVIHLENSVPSLQEQIDYVRFNCLGVVNYTVQTLNGTISYTFGSSVFSTYVTQQYGQANSNTAQNLLGPVSKITLTPITVFDSAWSEAYGQAFANDLRSAAGQNSLSSSWTSQGSGSSSSTSISSSSSSSGSSGSGSSGSSGSIQTNFLSSDFKCSASTSVISGSGVVKSIDANIVSIRANNGQDLKLILGACSSVYVSYTGTPQLGRTIFWNGFQILSDTYQVYSALFV